MQNLSGRSFRIIAALVNEYDPDLKLLPMQPVESADNVIEWVHDKNVEHWKQCYAKKPWSAERWPHKNIRKGSLKESVSDSENLSVSAQIKYQRTRSCGGCGIM